MRSPSKRLLPLILIGSARLVLAGDPAPVLASAAAAPTATEDVSKSALLPDQLLSALSRNLQSRFNLTGDLQLDFANPWTPPSRTAGVWRIIIVDYPAGAGSSMVVRFRIVADSTPIEDDTIVLRASLWRDAWFAREPLSSGAALDADRIELRRIDAFRVRDAIPSSAPDSGFVLSRSVQAGTLLTWNDLARRPLVRKGEMVEVSASEGLLRVTLKGMALQNGALGDIVTVRNPESLKVIPGQVVGENRVEVRL